MITARGGIFDNDYFSFFIIEKLKDKYYHLNNPSKSYKESSDQTYNL